MYSENTVNRFETDINLGLTGEQVETRKKQGLLNLTTSPQFKTNGQIVYSNIFTLFNILNFILALLILSVGSYKNLLFMGVVISNTFIVIFQELRAKKTIEKLSIICSPVAKVIRDGKSCEIAINEIVLDDIIELSSGNQIVTDAVVQDGLIEVDESLLTGESDPVLKTAGDSILSGSYVVSGHCKAKAEHVGDENYAVKLSAAAKIIKKTQSDIIRSLNIIIKVVSVAIIPIGCLLFFKQYFLLNIPLTATVVSTVAALIGMIPEGLMLLTSIALAVGVIKLAKHKTLVQELYCIETLARVDVLCLDKTGTITEGKMAVEDVIDLKGNSAALINSAMSAIAKNSVDENATISAIKAYFTAKANWRFMSSSPFSSAKKHSSFTFEKEGTFYLGAAEFILKDKYLKYSDSIEKYSANCNRVLLLACSYFNDDNIEPLALIVLQDKIRDNAKATLDYFVNQNVDIKVISGDNPKTVSNIAKKAGLLNSEKYIDATKLATEQDLIKSVNEYTVFGRVTPVQKKQIVNALKQSGHTVAMTGDGVNDILALKEADCSIAMNSGSDAAKSVSQLVLLDSDFASLPYVVAEGRRVINNIQRTSSLFLVKTIFSFILAIIMIFLQSSYPFIPIQLTLISTLTIGIPSFFLALEPNGNRISGKFLTNVLKNALPGALTVVTNILIIIFISKHYSIPNDVLSTITVIITAITCFGVLFKVCTPFNFKRILMFCSLLAAFVMCIIFFNSIFSLVKLSNYYLLLLLCITLLLYPTYSLISLILKKLKIIK